jgi:hypothetical protein
MSSVRYLYNFESEIQTLGRAGGVQLAARQQLYKAAFN